MVCSLAPRAGPQQFGRRSLGTSPHPVPPTDPSSPSAEPELSTLCCPLAR